MIRMGPSSSLSAAHNYLGTFYIAAFLLGCQKAQVFLLIKCVSTTWWRRYGDNWTCLTMSSYQDDQDKPLAYGEYHKHDDGLMKGQKERSTGFLDEMPGNILLVPEQRLKRLS